jgi:hypothetical protein
MSKKVGRKHRKSREKTANIASKVGRKFQGRILESEISHRTLKPVF